MVSGMYHLHVAVADYTDRLFDAAEDDEGDDKECNNFHEEDPPINDEDLAETSNMEPEADPATNSADLLEHAETRPVVEEFQPPAKKCHLDHGQSIRSKTAQALQTVLGNCPEVSKFDKLKTCLTKNPK